MTQGHREWEFSWESLRLSCGQPGFESRPFLNQDITITVLDSLRYPYIR